MKFRDLLKNTECQRNAVCSHDPVINALEAVVINEIRQISFYIVKLKELNFTNFKIMQEAVCALSVSITDVNFDKKSFFKFIENLRNIKNEVKKFFIQKAGEMDFSYEFLSPPNGSNEGKITYTDLIKAGENIINKFYNSIDEEKAGLLNLVILACRLASRHLVELSTLKDEIFENYYFEILRLLSIVNQIGTRKDKLVRRIKEFSKINYEIQKKLIKARENAYGKRQTAKTDTNIYKGKSVLIEGGDLDELLALLVPCEKENINVYINSSFISSAFYPKFTEFPNFKGLFGTNDIEYDFSKFEGPIYITKSSTKTLDLAVRGKIFSTKLIPIERAIKIEKTNLAPLIEEAKKQAGFAKEVKNNDLVLEFNLSKIDKEIENAKNSETLVVLGDMYTENDKFKNYKIINFPYPYEVQGLFYVLENMDNEKLSVYFANCSVITVGIILCILDKKLSGIYFEKCSTTDINPRVISCLNKNFNLQII